MNPSANSFTLRLSATSLAALTMSSCVASQPAVPPLMIQAEQDDAEVAVRGFLVAFENLEWDAFASYFAEDATAFFPAPEAPARFDGKAAIERQFRRVFDAIRKDSTATGPPFHKLEPVNLRIERPERDVAIATFMLVNEQRIARRTLILRRNAEGWRIIHLHASNTPL